jgi:hypothetical protein
LLVFTGTPTGDESSEGCPNAGQTHWSAPTVRGRPVSPGRIVQEEPARVQVLQEAILLHRLDGGVEGRDQVGAGGEDEAELLGAQRVADTLSWSGLAPM